MQVFDSNYALNQQDSDIVVPTTQMDLNNPSDISEIRLDCDDDGNNHLGARL